mgnify:CR=1 FL=1
MPIVNMHLVSHRFIAVLISRAVTKATFHAATSHPRGISLVIVVTTIATLTVWRASKFARAYHERDFEEIAAAQAKVRRRGAARVVADTYMGPMAWYELEGGPRAALRAADVAPGARLARHQASRSLRLMGKCTM